MAHPLLMVNGQKWNKILTYLEEMLAFIAYNDGASDHAVDIFIANYSKSIEDNKTDIFLQTANGIAQYLNFYNVLPSEGVGDEFKDIYFTGIAVSDCLVRLGYVDLNKYHLRAVLRLLDLRLEEPYHVRRDVLTDRIKAVILNDKIDAHFGKYGWYLIYKCLFNAAFEKNKKSVL